MIGAENESPGLYSNYAGRREDSTTAVSRIVTLLLETPTKPKTSRRISTTYALLDGGVDAKSASAGSGIRARCCEAWLSKDT